MFTLLRTKVFSTSNDVMYGLEWLIALVTLIQLPVIRKYKQSFKTCFSSMLSDLMSCCEVLFAVFLNVVFICLIFTLCKRLFCCVSIFAVFLIAVSPDDVV